MILKPNKDDFDDIDDYYERLEDWEEDWIEQIKLSDCKVIITGSEGFIGKELQKRFEDPICIDRKLGMELDDYLFLVPYAKIVYHLAAQTSVFNEDTEQIARDNILSFVQLANACEQNDVKLIYASSSTAYNISSAYGLSKKFDEDYARIYCPNAVGVRFHNVYSLIPRKDTLLWNLIHKNDVKLYNNGENIRCFTYVQDVVDGLVLLQDFTLPIINIVNEEPMTTLEFAEIVSHRFEIDYEVVGTIRDRDHVNQFIDHSIPTLKLNYKKVKEIFDV